MIDHVSFRVSSLEASRKFYGSVLGILGYTVFKEGEGFVGYKGPQDAMVWLRK